MAKSLQQSHTRLLYAYLKITNFWLYHQLVLRQYSVLKRKLYSDIPIAAGKKVCLKHYFSTIFLSKIIDRFAENTSKEFNISEENI